MCNNDNCEKNIANEDLKFFLDGNIDEYEADVVTVPRDEYNELVAESTILRVVERMVESDKFSNYSLHEYLKEIISIGKSDSDIPIESVPGPDEGDAE